MRKQLSVKVLLAAAVAVAATNSAVGPAAAATAPVTNPRVLIHYDLGAGRQSEAIVAEPDAVEKKPSSRSRTGTRQSRGRIWPAKGSMRGNGMKAVVGETVVAEAANEAVVRIEGNAYFPPDSGS
ncbi:hypothetical protein GCM10023194_77320 [Planotetraspora phitsanulokensis]|uniref:Uncharacterized protein n=1 Tax=Planotetraspora phitsanulokensis TaxID=575192 RepID=A0A8J3TZP5_9ACTN|nr:hypothetical protein [Planotetraspora phitsanulokensis]GII35546.1 hypothetical protein Pph01_05490 [Planotetraspora phitsanulokensis]